MKLLILAFLLPTIAIAQTRLRGQIIDEATGEPLPYATISLSKKFWVMMNAGKDGSFVMNEKLPDNDTITITNYGYIPVKAVIHDGLDSTFRLTRTQISQSKNDALESSQTSQINRMYSNDKGHYFSATIGLTEFAELFETESRNTQITEVKFSLKAKSKSLFRLNFYERDSLKGTPGRRINQQDLVYNAKNGINTISLEMEKIIVRGRHYFVSFEWLYLPQNFQEYVPGSPSKEERNVPQYGPGLLLHEAEKYTGISLTGSLLEKGRKLYVKHNGQWHTNQQEEEWVVSLKYKY